MLPQGAAQADPFAPQGAAPAAATADPFAPQGAVAAPEPAAPPPVSFLDQLKAVWIKAGPTGDPPQLDGGKLRPIMQMSGLENGILGQIWSMVDTNKSGTMDYKKLGFLLGLMGQAQRGEQLNIDIVG